MGFINPKKYNLPDGFRWREKQAEAIKAVIEAFENGYKNVLIDAPVGFGKTVVNYCIAQHFSDALYTTPQVVLLEQIENDQLLDIAVIKGRRNYPCPVNGKTAANGMCMVDRRFKCNEVCPYRVAKDRALNHRIAAMSFAYLIYDRFVPEEYSFGNRELVIVDEADDLESWADEFGSFRFKVNGKFESMDDVIVWARAVYSNVSARITELEWRDFLTEKELEELEKLRKYKIKLRMFLDKVESDKRNWVYEVRDGWLIVKPVNVGEILNELVWSRGKYRLATSGTIINKELFCKYCGLEVKETKMIKVGSIFPVENRKVVYMPVAKMTKDERANGYDRVVDAIVKIAEKHMGEKGMIHCHSYQIAQEVVRRLSLNRKVIVHDSSDRDNKFEEFVSSNGNAVFVSVGFSRGVDLKYDMCRWQVIVKVPFPSIEDIRVREIWVNRKAWKWARYQTIKNIVQAYGRVVRAEDDFGITYIIDKSFGYLFRYKSEFPKWFVEAVEEVEEVV